MAFEPDRACCAFHDDYRPLELSSLVTRPVAESISHFGPLNVMFSTGECLRQAMCAGSVTAGEGFGWVLGLQREPDHA